MPVAVVAEVVVVVCGDLPLVMSDVIVWVCSGGWRRKRCWRRVKKRPRGARSGGAHAAT